MDTPSNCSGIDLELLQRRAIEPGQMRSLLQRHQIVSADAFDDPKGFDNYATWDNVNAFVTELRESLFPNS